MIYGRVFAFAGLVALASANARVNLDNYSFESFVKEFKHKWTGEELAMRREIFEKELIRVRAHNAGNHKWTESINKYSAMTLSEKQSRLGRNKNVKKSHVPKHEVPLPADFKMKPLSELPKSVDWRNQPNVVTAVKDQGSCGSCWAFATAATLESHVALSTGYLFDLSPQQIAMCSPNPDNCGGSGGCQGATAEIAFDYVASAGILQEYELGYAAYYGQNSECGVRKISSPVATIEGYTKLPENNYSALMNAIAQVGPIAISVDASTWSAYKSGVFSACSKTDPVINHAVTLVGYGEEEDGTLYWIVRNSWSPTWGEDGYIRVLRSNDDEQNCGMDTEPQSGTACEGQDDPVKVCGTCGILYDSSYPVGVALA